MPVTLDRARRPSVTDYMAAAVLAYGVVYFWVELNIYYDPPWVLALLFYYLGGLIPGYLVCRRTGSAELAMGVRSSVASWVFTVVSLLAFTEGNTPTFFALLLVMFLLKTAEKIHSYGMEMVAILTLESVKPMVYVGGELSRVVLAPFLPALGPQYDALGDKLITIFEDRKNIEKLIKILEKMTKGEYTPRGKDQKPPEKAKEEAAAEPKEDAEPKKD